MAPNKALSEQQYHIIKQNLPAYHVRALTGADNVDKWTTEELWNSFLTGVHVVVGTPAVLADALTHGFVSMSRLSLLVYDECHRCTKKDPMNKIMQNFYHPTKQKADPIPHILALSASPVMNRAASQNSLQVIESNLDATTVTPVQYRDELDAHVHPPKLIKVEFGESCPDHISKACWALGIAQASYDYEQDPYVLELQAQSLQSDSKAVSKLQEVWDTGKTYCTDQLKLLSNKARHINNDLGPQCADWYISTCVSRYLESCKNADPLFLDLETKERRHLVAVLKCVVSNAESTSASSLEKDGTSNKAKALLDILAKDAQHGLRSIVFVEQRAMVLALAQLLHCSGISDRYKIGTFVGTSTFSGRASSLVDLFDAKSQAQDLKEFRDGSKNLMIATNVLEEGIDIPACNRVICFDLPKSLISFVQRRGRARQADSCYMLFVPQGDLQSDPARWQGLEKEMIKAYMDENRAQDTTAGSAELADDADDVDASHIKYVVESTGALLTLENARSHLHHLCAVATRHNSRYIDPRPEFTTEQHPVLKTWTASVTLPSFVHGSIRTAKSSRSWRGEQAATKDAAFSAYKALHLAGLVNNNLLPAIKSPTPEAGSQHAEQPSLVQVAKQWSIWDTCAGSGILNGPTWHASQITLRLSGLEVLSQVLWLPFGTDTVQTIKLHWNAGVCYEAQIHPLTYEALDAKARSKAADWTSLVLRSVLANSIPNEHQDFALLLSQPDGKTASDFSGAQAGDEFISSHQPKMNGLASCGIVRVAGHHGRAYILKDTCEPLPGSQDSTQVSLEMQLVVSAFPKRRSFLKAPESNQAGAAYTSTQSFPVSQCTVDRLPIRHSIMAVLLPSILHQIEILRVVHCLNATILGTVQMNNPATLLEAISAPAAQTTAGDYNRLEYLGDAILKFCTELQLVAQHLTFPEAFLSAGKDRIVCNSNLAQASREAGLDQFILTELFTGKKWQPPYLHELATTASGEASTREMSTKVLADVVEALIGAAFVDGGLYKAYACIRTLLPKETWWTPDVLFDAILKESTHAGSICLERLEKLVGHRFGHPRLLLEAITHASQPNNTVPSYERLEFFGDAVLDLIITPKLHAHARKLRHWDLHRTHEALVNGYFLGYCCMTLSGEEEIYDVVNVSSTKSLEMEARRSLKTYHLYDFLRASGQLLDAKQESIARFEALSGPIATALQCSDTYPWPDLTALQPEKFFSDMVEAILGAIYLDTRGDLGVCEMFLEKLGVLPAMRSMLDREMETCFPKERVGILADREGVEYKTERMDGEVATWQCVVLVGQKEVTRVGGIKTKEEAEVRAADAAAYELALGHGRSKTKKLSVSTRDQTEE
jgi:dsRNA-specific ribonuclease/ERCC4-related helicase